VNHCIVTVNLLILFLLQKIEPNGTLSDDELPFGVDLSDPYFAEEIGESNGTVIKNYDTVEFCFATYPFIGENSKKHFVAMGLKAQSPPRLLN
jgi:hypothetical protein